MVGSRTIMASPLMVFLVAQALGAQDRKSGTQVQPAVQTDSICQVQGDFSSQSQLTACQVSRVPVPPGVPGTGAGAPISSRSAVGEGF